MYHDSSPRNIPQTTKHVTSTIQNQAASTAQDHTSKASTTAQDTYGQAKASTGNAYNTSAPITHSIADDTAARAQDLKRNAEEGVDTRLEMGQSKASDVSAG